MPRVCKPTLLLCCGAAVAQLCWACVKHTRAAAAARSDLDDAISAALQCAVVLLWACAAAQFLAEARAHTRAGQRARGEEDMASGAPGYYRSKSVLLEPLMDDARPGASPAGRGPPCVADGGSARAPRVPPCAAHTHPRWLAQPAAASAAQAPGCSAVNPVDVWILAGQSNCVGTNKADGQPMPALAAPWPGRILSFNNRSGCWQDARPNVHLGVYGYADADSCGPGMAFARTLVQTQTSCTVGLVPTACGGTNLFDQWAPGNTLWSNMVADTTAAMQQLGCRGRLRGVIWIQGESDAGSRDTAGAYGAHFAAWLAATRHAVRTHHPCLPVLTAIMSVRGREGAFPFIADVAEQQRALTLPGLFKCEMAGFEMYEDGGPGGQLVHLTKAGCCAMGVCMGYQAEAAAVGGSIGDSMGSSAAAGGPAGVSVEEVHQPSQHCWVRSTATTV